VSTLFNDKVVMAALTHSYKKTVQSCTSKARYTLATKSTVAETGDKSATKSTVADAVNFVAAAVIFVADMVDFVASFGDKLATT